MSSPTREPNHDKRDELRKIGKYEIIRKLGAGGMGTVFLATDSELKRTVALKVLSKDKASNPTLVRRFKSEGQAAALLQHRNIVSVFEAGQADGYLFLALEFVDGIDLLEWVHRHGPIPPKRSVEIMRQAAEALQHAYERNIVHRDIKPSNLMISRDGTVKLTDMGLARSIDDTLDTTITRDGTTVGTVDYMAPEQASSSKAADIRSDLYSLGCSWYHLLTGTPPYPQGSVTNKIAAHIGAPLPDPRVMNPKVPEAVTAVIHRLMAKKKEQRYQTPAELLDDLNSVGLQRTSEVPDLLAMFGDDLEDLESEESLPAKDGGGSSTDFTVNAKSKKSPATANLAQQKRTPASNLTTRTEIPAQAPRSKPQTNQPRQTDVRTPLVRMAIDGEGHAVQRRPVPWGLIVLGVILLALTLFVRALISRYSVDEDIPANWTSPYSVDVDQKTPVPSENATPQ